MWKALLPAAGGIAGGIFGGPAGAAAGATIGAGVAGSMGADEANEANAKIAFQNRDWQEYMSNTAHQRQVADLRKAGLNPILSANSGASTPSGATATMQNAAEPMMNSAISAASTLYEAQKQKEEIRLIKAQTAKTEVDAMVATKGIPEAEAKNTVWKGIKEGANKIKEYFQSTPDTPQTERIRMRENIERGKLKQKLEREREIQNNKNLQIPKG